MRSDPLAVSPSALRPLTGEALLTAWERGGGRSWSGQALELLSAGCPDLASSLERAMPIAKRDRLLLELHRLTFGETMPSFAVCAACGERLEFELPSDWAVGVLDAAAGDLLDQEGWTVTLRLADGFDLEHAAAEPDIGLARSALVERCVSATGPDGRTIPIGDLPETIRAMAETRLSAMHEAAELTAVLTCPACQAAQSVLIDIPAYLWAETRNAARRLVADVGEIAHAFGWSEAAILSMSAARRRAYQEMIRA